MSTDTRAPLEGQTLEERLRKYAPRIQQEGYTTAARLLYLGADEIARLRDELARRDAALREAREAFQGEIDRMNELREAMRECGIVTQRINGKLVVFSLTPTGSADHE